MTIPSRLSTHENTLELSPATSRKSSTCETTQETLDYLPEPPRATSDDKMTSGAGTVALICFIYPSSEEKQSIVTSHLQSASKEYYRHPSSLCTTWSYFTLSTRKGGLYQPLSTSFPPKSENPKLLIGGVEIYTDKSALSTQMGKPWFKEFARKAKDESWYQEGKGEEMRVWEPAGGFVSRKGREEGGKGTIMMLAVFECKDSGKAVESTAKNLKLVSLLISLPEQGWVSCWLTCAQ